MKKMSYVIPLCLLQVGVALADHEPGEGECEKATVGELAREAQELTEAALYSPLNYSVKAAVVRLKNQIDRLARCARGSTIADDHEEELSIVPEICRGDLLLARRAAIPVAYYLYDADRDLPNVYQPFSEVQKNLTNLR